MDELFRITFLVDQETLYFIQKMHGLKEDGEFWLWESTEVVNVSS